VRDEKCSVDSFEVYVTEKKVKVLIIPEAGTTVHELKAAIEFCSKVIPNLSLVTPSQEIYSWI